MSNKDLDEELANLFLGEGIEFFGVPSLIDDTPTKKVLVTCKGCDGKGQWLCFNQFHKCKPCDGSGLIPADEQED